jgi:hypothetical protein
MHPFPVWIFFVILALSAWVGQWETADSSRPRL